MHNYSSLEGCTERRLCRFGLEQFGSHETTPRETAPRETNSLPSSRPSAETPRIRLDPVRERQEQQADLQLAEADLGAEMLKDGLTGFVERNNDVLMNWETADDAVVEKVKIDLRRALGLRRHEKILVAPNLDRGGLMLTVSNKTNPLHVHAHFSRRWGKAVDTVTLNQKIEDRSESQVNFACRRLLELDQKLTNRRTVSHVSPDKDRTVIEVTDEATKLPLGRVVCDDRGRIVNQATVEPEAIRKVTRPALE